MYRSFFTIFGKKKKKKLLGGGGGQAYAPPPPGIVYDRDIHILFSIYFKIEISQYVKTFEMPKLKSLSKSFDNEFLITLISLNLSKC